MSDSLMFRVARKYAFLQLVVLLAFCANMNAQIYSPNLLRDGQPDSTDLKKFADSICRQASAHTPREKAEAIWRFFLTDGRYVKPGFWYHIAGWTYEEPTGEVLDPMKLLNSYGFGLCYHIAPLLTAVYDAAGFDNARVWFLTGHTVAEVFYNGSYHYFDSDMMGYNVPGLGSFRGKPVASVRQLEHDSNIILGKLLAPNQVKPGVVDDPWYPADVKAAAMNDLSDLFRSSQDNFLYPYTRYASGHSMAFVLRPGEKLIRYFKPEEPGLFYLPYKYDGKQWTEFPREFAEYHIRTADGPRSQKDARSWATGRIEYSPPDLGNNQSVRVIDMPSPYVVIDAHFNMNADLPSRTSSILVETSTDAGRTWVSAGELKGPHHGFWSVEPHTIFTSAHGRKTSVTGTYGYQVRITQPQPREASSLSSLQLISRVQINPRSLPFVASGQNEFVFSTAAPDVRIAVPAPLEQAPAKNLELVNDKGQGFLRPVEGQTGEAVYKLEADGKPLIGFDVGARFLDMPNGLAPDKLTAETRRSFASTRHGTASIEWSTSPTGPFHTLWKYPLDLSWRDGDPVDRLLPWPDIFKEVRHLSVETVYVKFRSSGPAIDSIRLAIYKSGQPASGNVKITQIWREAGVRHQHVEKIASHEPSHSFHFTAAHDPENEAVIFEEESP